ncbi:MAG: hypothetical protein KKB70_07965 [Proteobacteria bacterium]|nr:hypothetical protein [Pseudomonadota bacterium]
MKKLHLIIVASILLLLAGWVSVFAQESPDEKIVMVKLEQPIIMGETSSTQASVATLNRNAIETGLANVRLIGTSTFSQAEGGSTRTAIDWHSISYGGQDATSQVQEQLERPLASQFATDDPRAEPGTEISAKGNWDLLLKAVNNLRSAEANEVLKTEDVSDDKGSDDGLKPVGPTTSSSTPNPVTPNYSSANTDVMTSTYEDCPVFVDVVNLAVKEQKAKKTVGESGTVYEAGLCVDTGVTYPIESKDGDCGYTHDFVEEFSTKQEQLYYLSGSTEINVGSCRDSNSTFPHITVDCDPEVDAGNDQVVLMRRVTFEIGAGVNYIDEDDDMGGCQAYEGSTFPIQQETCSTGAFRHDFVNNVSYAQISKFYENDEGEKTYVNNCVDDTTKFYSHRFETDTCGGWTYNDAALTATQSSYRYILDDSNSTVVIEDCEDRPDTVTTYAYLGLEAAVTRHTYTDGSAQTYTVPEGVSVIDVTIVAGGAPGGAPQAGGLGSLGGSPGTPGSLFCINGRYAWGGGGGGAGGQIIEQSLDVTPGQEFTLTVGASKQNSTFNGVVASWDSGSSPGGRGGNPSCSGNWAANAGTPGAGAPGYTTEAVLPHTNECYTGGCTQGGGNTGLGYGAGGLGCTGTSTTPQRQSWSFWGTPGVVDVSYDVMKYMRPDSTFYYRIP